MFFGMQYGRNLVLLQKIAKEEEQIPTLDLLPQEETPANHSCFSLPVVPKIWVKDIHKRYHFFVLAMNNTEVARLAHIVWE